MTRSKAALVAMAVCFLFVAWGFDGTPGGSATSNDEQSSEIARCGRCGDGVCVRQCGENAQTCPADCAPKSSKAMACGRCGDGQCVPQCGENAQTCPKDCSGSSTKVASVHARSDLTR